MDNQFSYSVPFESRLIKNINIKKIDKISNIALPCKSSFIESSSLEDAKALQTTSYFWGLNSAYSDNIADTAFRIAQLNAAHASIPKFLESYKNSKVFALTLQVDNFESLNSEKILGMVEVDEKVNNNIFIRHIQADPEEIFSRSRTYSQIGTEILNSLKGLYNKITVHPTKSKTVKHFYEINGFKACKDDSDFYEWSRPKSEWIM